MKNKALTRAIVREFGLIQDVVQLENMPLPELAEGDARVKMVYATINPSDIITISGAYRSRISVPFVPGFEGVGVIEQAPANSHLPVGQRVLPIGSMGNWQTFKDTKPEWCFTLPDFVSDRQAVNSYVNPMTALLMLTEALDAKPGQRILVNAANSAIGKMLIRIANQLGMTPIAVVRKRENIDIFEGYQLETVLNSSDAAYLQELQRIKRSGGVHAIFDCIGGDESLTFAEILIPGGQFIHYGLLSGKPVPPQFWRSRPDIRFMNFHLRQWIHSQEKPVVQKRIDQVMELIRDGVVHTEIATAFSLNNISDAIEAAVFGELKGKILIEI
ncbi:zinc-dependent alcohol dehydrogenase family protein [Serratia sp. M24T3]|uniref:zinc-dependent alcohol dehydrogenase family protein n=1 Tax=Serratia sp. M24T3 TaxID=932213 RepID=UPI00025B8E0A|nr:zinc-dependent alcohol dehydrogenase family protein [Serratia sp. M24T3]EIC86392.1 Quinone oxidoreductase [Serratia sp. M24T3]